MHSRLKSPPDILAKMIQNTLVEHIINLGIVALTINFFHHSWIFERSIRKETVAYWNIDFHPYQLLY